MAFKAISFSLKVPSELPAGNMLTLSPINIKSGTLTHYHISLEYGVSATIPSFDICMDGKKDLNITQFTPATTDFWGEFTRPFTFNEMSSIEIVFNVATSNTFTIILSGYIV